MLTDNWTSITVLALLLFALVIYALQRLPYFVANTLKKPRLAIAMYTWMANVPILAGSSYINRAQSYILLKEYEQALQDVERGLALRPQSVIGYNNRGTAHLYLKQYRSALQDYGRAIEMKPTSLFAYQNRALTHCLLKEYQQALQDAEYVLSIQPSNPQALSYAIASLTYLGDFQRALEIANNTLRLRPYRAICYHNRGFVYQGLHQPELAKQDLMRSCELEPDNCMHALALEWHRLCFEEPDEEMPQRLETLATYPPLDVFHQHVPLLSRGMALWLRGAYEESLVTFEQALTLAPDDEELYFWVSMACAALGRDQEARDALDHALQLGLPRHMLAPLKLLREKNPEFAARYA
jgi:tetratricopeptide (TPR) repeat protein